MMLLIDGIVHSITQSIQFIEWFTQTAIGSWTFRYRRRWSMFFRD